ncbi:GNAT family N-acetyltransferase [Microlunatus speluncae]|uniref:GNAT family N-acetyltransferase n=1 Tax=Microlunatus speluncae TaxID=2594267 RepID=UPI0012665B5A|nr:GNAT family N-acetyltransferase [Microlunatus speluncae]
MQIRPAQPADAAAVTALLEQLGYPQDGESTTAARIQGWADDQSSAAYVAEADGDVLGVVAVHLCPFFERNGHWARIVALVVSHKARGRGIGGLLVAATEEFAAEHGCERMEVTSSNYRDDAHGLYRSRGYLDQTPRSSRFIRDLDRSGAVPA